MLKWTVNGSRRSYLSSVAECETIPQKIDCNIAFCSLNSLHEEGSIYSHAERFRVKRKPRNLTIQRRKTRSREKENQLTSTPLPVSMSEKSSVRKLDSLRDLSSIAHDDLQESLYKSKSKQNIDLLSPEVRLKRNIQSVPSHYASTLPTFEVEYSPCGLVPGPILALRGVGIADTYFEKPRYLNQESQNDSIQQNLASKLSSQVRNPPIHEESSMISSSKMGDMTLERMIDAILESAQKECKLPKSVKMNSTPGMSPTYTPADDPASDLNEYWDASSDQYYQINQNAIRSKYAESFNEREIGSPFSRHYKNILIGGGQEKEAFKLRRQRAVRRKRHMALAAPTSIVQTSSQKMFFCKGVFSARPTNHKNSHPSHCKDTNLKENESKTVCHNISPDSGRNSSSDYEDSTMEGKNCNIECIDKTDKMFDSTKRRLSFSNNMNGC